MISGSRISLKLLAALAALVMWGAVIFVVFSPALKKVSAEDPSHHDDVVHIDVKEGGFFFANGESVGEGLRLPNGHRVVLVLHYKYATGHKTASSDESPIHQFTITADGVRLESDPLSPENPEVKMVLDVGSGGVREYMWYCNINCNAMGILFKKIVVVS